MVFLKVLNSKLKYSFYRERKHLAFRDREGAAYLCGAEASNIFVSLKEYSTHLTFCLILWFISLMSSRLQKYVLVRQILYM